MARKAKQPESESIKHAREVLRRAGETVAALRRELIAEGRKLRRVAKNADPIAVVEGRPPYTIEGWIADTMIDCAAENLAEPAEFLARKAKADWREEIEHAIAR